MLKIEFLSELRGGEWYDSVLQWYKGVRGYSSGIFLIQIEQQNGVIWCILVLIEIFSSNSWTYLTNPGGAKQGSKFGIVPDDPGLLAALIALLGTLINHRVPKSMYHGMK